MSAGLLLRGTGPTAGPTSQGLSPGSTRELALLMAHRDAAPGTAVFSQGERTDALFLVVSGRVKLERRCPDGRQTLLSVRGPGDLFGEMSLFDPGPRMATATVLSGARLGQVGRAELRAWLHDRPEVAEEFLGVLVRRLRRLDDALTERVSVDVPGRVARTLLELAARFGVPEGRGVRVDHGLTQGELAQLVGASRETVNKVLSDFASRGWTQGGARAVTLLDPERLARRVG